MSSLFAAELSLLDQAVPQSGCQAHEDSAARMGVPGGLFLLAFPGRMDCRGGLKFLLSAALLPLLLSLFTRWFTALLPAFFSELSLSLVSLAFA